MDSIIKSLIARVNISTGELPVEVLLEKYGPEEFVNIITRTTMERLKEPQIGKIMRLFCIELYRNEKIGDFFRNTYIEPSYHMWEHLFRRMMDLGYIREYDARQLAREFFDYCIFLYFDCFVIHYDEKACDKSVDDMMDSLSRHVNSSLTPSGYRRRENEQQSSDLLFRAPGFLAVARDIAGRMNGELVSISAVIDQGSIVTDADVIGVVFPVYFASNDNGGIPLIVGRFIGKMDNIGSKYIFAICTHSGMPGTTIEHFRRMVEARGGKLAAGFAVTMSTPPTAREKLAQFLHGKKPADMNAMRAKGRQQETFDNARRKVEEICEYVSAKREGKLETRGFVQKLIFIPLLLVLIKPIFRRRYEKLAGASGVSFNELINGADRSSYRTKNAMAAAFAPGSVRSAISKCPIKSRYGNIIARIVSPVMSGARKRLSPAKSSCTMSCIITLASGFRICCGGMSRHSSQ